MSRLKYIYDHVEIWISSVFFTFMSIAVTMQLVSRAVGKPIFFTEEIARYSYIWVAFLCMSLGEKQRAHFNVTVFTLFLKGRAEAVLEFAADAICTVVFLYLFYWSVQYWPFTVVLKTPALELPMTVVSSCLCIGFFMAICRRVEHAVKHLKLAVTGGAA